MGRRSRTFMPLKISNEELLQIPESIEQPEEPEEEDSGQEGNSDNNTADPLFDDLDFF